MFADGLFMSKLIYLIPLWGGCEKFLIKALQILQNKAARSVTRLGIYTPVKTLLNQCGWLSVHQLVFLHTELLLYKTLQFESPEHMFSMTGRDYNYKTSNRCREAENCARIQTRSWFKLEILQMEIHQILEPAATEHHQHHQPWQVQSPVEGLGEEQHWYLPLI